MTEKWELCTVSKGPALRHVSITTYNPRRAKGYIAESFLYGPGWWDLSKGQKKEWTKQEPYTATYDVREPFDAVVCKLLAEGWMPLQAAEIDSPHFKLLFRRPYREDGA